MNINKEIQKLLRKIGPGRMSSTAYDTAWVARLGEVDWELSSQALNWLSEHQLSDGSWGADKPIYYHDRIICTLATMIALTHRGRRAHDRKQIESGIVALERIMNGATKSLQTDPNGATIGFEMIVPTLVSEAQNLGIIKQQGENIVRRLCQQRSVKLEKIQGQMINKHTTMAFSAEMAGNDGQRILDTSNLQEVNGSVGHSPSASAYFTLSVKKGEKSAIEYLHKVIQSDGGVPNVAPFDAFEISWSLWNLSLIPGLRTTPEMKALLGILSEAWKPGVGIGFATQYSVQDSDVTSFVYDTLARFGTFKDIDSILRYEEKEYFRCYPLEANPSISANIHVLGALRQAGFEKNHPSVKKIVSFLEKAKGESPFWIDKWHSSPYYTTAHAIITCTGYVDTLVEDSIEWITSSQYSNGAWGTYLPTAEETAYAIQAMCIWNRNARYVDKQCIRKGATWLEDHAEEPYPPLWIGKCLYNPNHVIQSAIISALALVKQL
jgi:halimadienyl-diphosphate synthase